MVFDPSHLPSYVLMALWMVSLLVAVLCVLRERAAAFAAWLMGRCCGRTRAQSSQADNRPQPSLVCDLSTITPVTKPLAYADVIRSACRMLSAQF